MLTFSNQITQVTVRISTIDISIILIYFISLAVIGWKYRHESTRDETEYLLAGRRLTLPAFIATLVSTWYGGILGVGEFSFNYGISNWLAFGAPYYLAALIFAFFLARLARRSRIVSIPDQLEKAYGRKTALTGALIVFIMTVPAAYVLMLGELFRFMFGGYLLFWIIAGTLFSTAYVAFGGFRSVVRTDLIQFILMYLSFGILLYLAVTRYGGISFLKSNLPDSHMLWHGGNSPSTLFVWYFIALATLIEPSFYQRCFAARDEKVARNGILISILFWIAFDFLSTFSGLYARAILTDDTNPMLSYPLLAEKLLPVGLQGIFYLGLLSVVMSTVDSYSLLAAQTLGRDIILRSRDKISTPLNNRHIQFGLLLSAVLAVMIAVWKESAVSIWHDLGSIGTSMLLLPMAGSFSRKPAFSGNIVYPSMIITGGVTLFWTLNGSYGQGYPLGIQPIYIGLSLSVLLLFVGRLLMRNREL